MKLHPLYLNGKWVHTGSPLRVLNPATGEVVGEVCTVGRSAVAQAIADGHAAFLDWRQRTGKARGEYLNKIAGELERRRDEIARTITTENGKPLAQSLGEVAMSVDHLRWFAEEARRAYGRIVPHQVDGKRHLVVKTPMGVVAAISPWNFPLGAGAAQGRAGPGRRLHRRVRNRPAPRRCARWRWPNAVEAAGLPAGRVPACGRTGRRHRRRNFWTNPLCRKITFTGSTEVGRLLIRARRRRSSRCRWSWAGTLRCWSSRMPTWTRRSKGALITKFRNTGQSCIAANRIYVQRPVYDKFLEKFTRATQAMKTGDGLEEGVEVGPLINEESLAKALDHIQDAVRLGARLLCGGKRIDRKGWFLEPTVLADVPAAAVCMSEETFAPVAPVCPFDTEEEAIARANASPYGLSAYAFTRDLGRAFRLMETLEAGTIGINDSVPSTSQCPFGGVKHSGWGRELGSEGMDAFLETKHISLGIQS